MNTTYKNALEVFVTTHQFGCSVEVGGECDCRLLDAAAEYQALKEIQQSANGLCSDNVHLRTELTKAMKVIEQVKRDGDLFDHLRGFAGYIKAVNFLVGEVT